MFDYLKIRDTALGLLNKFGRVITIKQTSSGSYDPATGTNSATVVDVTAIACDFSVKGETTVNGTLILSGDRYALVADSAGTVVSVKDKLLMDGVIWSIVAVLEIAPAGVTVVNKVYIRK